MGQLRSASDTVKPANPLRYVGKEGYYSDDTGLMLLGARYYDPLIGRFITKDPARDGMNWYEYAGNNPVVSCDPTGKAYMTYDGSKLTLYHGNGNVWLSYAAVSGRPPKIGPIAGGVYRLAPKNINHLGENASFKNAWQIAWRSDLLGWGFWRVHLENTSVDHAYEGNYYHHNECFIHGGDHEHVGTAGCISIRDCHFDYFCVYLFSLK